MEDGGLRPLVRFDCVSKIHYSSSRPTREHRASLTLGLAQGGQPCVQVWEKANNFPKNLKLSAASLASPVTSRVHEGRLSIVFRGINWATIVIKEVTDIAALRRCCDLLESIANGTFNAHTGSIAETPPRTGRGLSLQPSPGSGRSLSLSPDSGRKPPLRQSKTTNPVLSRGAAMVAASRNATAQNTTSSFYKSSSPHLSDPLESFHPPRLPSNKQFHHVKPSAKRTLVLSDTNHNGPTQDHDDDFKPAKSFRFPPPPPPSPPPPLLSSPPATRPPLSDQTMSYQTTAHQRLAKQEGAEFEGFANLGNTCYMNAVLQSLLALDPFAEDLLNFRLARSAPHRSLYRLLFLLLKSKRARDSYDAQRVLLRNIKAAISERAVKFGGSLQQDAHELLGQCLDQLKEEVAGIDLNSDGEEDGDVPLQEQLSPVRRNFECQILTTITCKSCGKSTRKSELIYDFALQLPKSVLVKALDQANLQQLFNLYFSSEEVECSCAHCDGRSATLSHKLGQLPRVLILHLKRYGYIAHLSRNSKRVDNIRIPRFIDIGELCAEEVKPPQEFKGPWPRDRSSLAVMASRGDKENVSLESFEAEPPVARPPSSRLIQLQDISSVLLKSTQNENSVNTPSLTPADRYHPPLVTSADDDTKHSVLGKRRNSDGRSSDSLAPGDVSSKVMKIDSQAAEVSWLDNSGQPQQQRGEHIDGSSAPLSPKALREFDAVHPETITIEDSPASLSHIEAALDNSSSMSSGNTAPPQTGPSERTPSTAPEEVVQTGTVSSSPPPLPPSPVLLVTPPPTVTGGGGEGGGVQGSTPSQEEIDEDLKQAIEASLQMQYGGSVLEMSEEEQLKLALQLSIAESSPEEVTSPSSPLPRVTDTPTPEKTPREAYRLVSIVSHIGRGSGGGHYISDVYSVKEKTWKTCNDSQISELREEDVRQRRQGTGYIFFYMHISVLQSVSRHLKAQS